MSMDPIVTKETIKTDYLDYLSSILSVRNEEISQKAREAVNRGTFVKGPYLEATPPFLPGKSLEELAAEGIVSEEFSRIATDIHYSRELYIHQEKAIRKVLSDNKNIIVATGTGSGKTECYFMPIISCLMEQAKSGKLKPGVQALLLFPMNALANDQLKKLRQLLAQYPAITFGRYTGETSFENEDTARRLYEQKYNKKPLPNELLSRQKMQETPPHILLTNYAMLEYLLLRPEDSVFFDGAMANDWRFLVIDEAHTYKGANGTEIALLLRRLKERIAHCSDRKLRCIATSATLGSEDAKDDLAVFAEGLFGEPFLAEDIITSQRIKRIKSESMRPFQPEEYTRLKIKTGSLLENEKSLLAYNELIHDRRIVDIHHLLEEKPRLFEDVAEVVFADLDTVKDRRNNLALLVELATLAKPDKETKALLPARYHLFVKSLEGMFLSIYPENRVYLDRKEIAYINGLTVPVFELADCQRCGQEYIVGKTTMEGYLKQVNELDKPEYYLIAKQDTVEDVEVDDDVFEDADVSNLEPYVLCTACGKIMPIAQKEKNCCDLSDTGKRIRVYKLNYSGRHSDVNTCTMCGTVSSSVVKRFLTANHAATFTLANSLYGMIPPKPVMKVSEVDDDFFSANVPSVNEEYTEESGRKLLIFSDNRQEAAFFAGYMGNKYNQLMWRRLILKELQKWPEGLRVDDLMNGIVAEADRAGLYNRNSVDTLSDAQKRILAAQYVMYEFLGNDRGTGLEGRGYIEIYPEKLPAREKWNLTPDETWNVLRAMMDTLRLVGASVYPDQVNPKDEFFAPRNREVLFRKEQRDQANGKEIFSFIPDGARKNKRLKYLIKLLKQQGVDQASVDIQARLMLDESYGLLTRLAERGYFLRENLNALGIAYVLNFKKWYMRYLPDDATLYRCDKCGRISTYHVHDICPEFKCEGKLLPVSARELRDDPYYHGQYASTKIIPMIAKEHTAQLTKEAAGDYQRDFEDGRINVLSCSTTFEMGVDVGELEATFLRNVPPETANYIQRAGRAGRRTSSTAFSVTFARRNSHDINFFNHPSDIINGKIRPPYIEISNDKIALRHVNSVVIAWFFRNHPEYFKNGVKAIIGRGGGRDAASLLWEELREYPAELQTALSEILPPPLFNHMGIKQWIFVDRLVGEDGSLTKAISTRKEELVQLQMLRQQLFDRQRSTHAVEKLINTYTEEKAIDFLATNGVLPKYGFPVDVVQLNILNNSEDAKRVDLSRDLRIAIAEFAPPGNVVANGKIWTSRYINTIPNKGWPAYRYYECSKCRHISPPEELTIIGQEENAEDKLCPVCSESMKAKKFLIPIFGFSTAMDEKPSSVGESKPKRGYSNQIQFWGIGELDSYQQDQWKERELLTDERRVKAEYSPNGKLVVLNRGNNGSGLWVCNLCGFVKEYPTQPKHKNKYGHDCVNTHLSNVSLGHSFATDILKLEIPFHLSPFENDGKDVRLSVLYAILDGASDALGISRNDINGCIDFNNGRPALVLFDEASGGAGHVKNIFEHIESVFQAGLKRVKGDCGCSEETSCYGCLRNYGNQYAHEKLTRGGAKEYLNWLLAKGEKEL